MFKYFKNIILSPIHLGQSNQGVANAPSHLSHIFHSEILNNNIKLYKVHLNHTNIEKDLLDIYSTSNYVSGTRINVGGDHSMSIATVAHTLNHHSNVKVIWIDAHADINTKYSSKSKNVHGMSLAYLSGLESQYLKSYPFIKKRISLDDICYIGVRSLDPFEKDVISDNNMTVITSGEVNNDPTQVLRAIEQFCGTDSHIHISFDVDAMCPKLIPCTGTPVKNGLQVKETRFLLENIMKRLNVVAMDVVEYNPDIGIENGILTPKRVTTANIIELLSDSYTINKNKIEKNLNIIPKSHILDNNK